MRKTAIATIGVIGLVVGYAFLDDLFNGLPFTRASSSWLGWAVGLLALGVVGLLIEGASEWAFGPSDPSQRRPRRIIRIAVALLIGVGVVALGILVSGYLR